MPVRFLRMISPPTSSSLFKIDTSAPSQGLGRSVPLDFLRAVAIFCILLHHNVIAWQIGGPFARVGHFFAREGWLGVDLFFVLSGFLIGGLLFREIRRHGTLDVRRFLLRRGLKIWPAYYVLLIFAALWLPVTPFGERSPFYATWLNWLHLQNYRHTPLGHTWSLAVEEHFYLALPLALLLVLRFEKNSRLRLRFFPYLALGVAIICLVCRFSTSSNGPYWFWIHGTPTHLRMDSLNFGAALAYLFHYENELWNRISRPTVLLIALSAILLFPVLKYERESHFSSTWGFTFAYLAFGALLIACIGPQDLVSRSREKIWSCRPIRSLAAIGTFSYGIYLWHHDIAVPLFHWFWLLPSVSALGGPVRWLAATTTYVAFALVSGILLSRLIEAPFLKLRDRLYPPKDGRINGVGLLSLPDLAPSPLLDAKNGF